MRHIEYLADVVGVRHAGSSGERAAADYIASVLETEGYAVTYQTFDLPGGLQSRNVIAELGGRSDRVMLLGSHYDTKGGSPGANDNGTGTAALLALAHELRDEPLDVTVRFVFFGAEEAVDTDSDDHHYGSRHYVRGMAPAEQQRLQGMISVDMIGFGPEFRVRTMGIGPQSLSDTILAYGQAQGLPLTYLRDRGSSGWSDHEPFEAAGFPAAWIEWRDDPATHTPQDVSSHVDQAKVAMTGQLVLDFVRALSAD
jgi:Zn-dependent M28 family amino/carboxypeptidase